LPPWTPTNFFPSRHRSCPQCSTRTVTVAGEKVTEYYHRIVVCHLIGYQIALPLDAEPIRPHETELDAAKRLVRRVLVAYPRFFDGMVGDALYNEAEFINLSLDHHKEFIAVLKNNNRSVLEDAEGLRKIVPPQCWHEDDGPEVTYWDIEGFQREKVDKPLRVLSTHERETKRRRIAQQWREEQETHDWHWITSIASSLLSTRHLWLAGHRRWDIENDLFNQLTTHYGLDHCFKHDPTAIINFVLTLFIAFILLQCFYHRNLKPEIRAKLNLTLIGLAAKLYQGLTDPELSAPWLNLASGIPP